MAQCGKSTVLSFSSIDECGIETELVHSTKFHRLPATFSIIANYFKAILKYYSFMMCHMSFTHVIWKSVLWARLQVFWTSWSPPSPIFTRYSLYFQKKKSVTDCFDRKLRYEFCSRMTINMKTSCNQKTESIGHNEIKRVFDPPGSDGRMGGHYFRTCCLYVR